MILSLADNVRWEDIRATSRVILAVIYLVDLIPKPGHSASTAPPWWSRGWDFALPLQGPQVPVPGWGTKITMPDGTQAKKPPSPTQQNFQ